MVAKRPAAAMPEDYDEDAHHPVRKRPATAPVEAAPERPTATKSPPPAPPPPLAPKSQKGTAKTSQLPLAKQEKKPSYHQEQAIAETDHE
eukprot:2061468-Pyramimonas_sp.AAC.1